MLQTKLFNKRNKLNLEIVKDLKFFSDHQFYQRKQHQLHSVLNFKLNRGKFQLYHQIWPYNIPYIDTKLICKKFLIKERYSQHTIFINKNLTFFKYNDKQQLNNTDSHTNYDTIKNLFSLVFINFLDSDFKKYTLCNKYKIKKKLSIQKILYKITSHNLLKVEDKLKFFINKWDKSFNINLSNDNLLKKFIDKKLDFYNVAFNYFTINDLFVDHENFGKYKYKFFFLNELIKLKNSSNKPLKCSSVLQIFSLALNNTWLFFDKINTPENIEYLLKFYKKFMIMLSYLNQFYIKNTNVHIKIDKLNFKKINKIDENILFFSNKLIYINRKKNTNLIKFYLFKYTYIYFKYKLCDENYKNWLTRQTEGQELISKIYSLKKKNETIYMDIMYEEYVNKYWLTIKSAFNLIFKLKAIDIFTLNNYYNIPLYNLNKLYKNIFNWKSVEIGWFYLKNLQIIYFILKSKLNYAHLSTKKTLTHKNQIIRANLDNKKKYILFFFKKQNKIHTKFNNLQKKQHKNINSHKITTIYNKILTPCKDHKITNKK